MKKKNIIYRIGDLARLSGLTVRTIRYYEGLGLVRAVDRDEGNHRRFSERNLIYIKRILQLKSYGLSLEEIKEFFDLAAKDRSGESCRSLLIRKYSEQIQSAEWAKRQAEKKIEELKWHVKQLRDVENFFECPGRQCRNCLYKEGCDLAGQAACEDGEEA